MAIEWKEKQKKLKKVRVRNIVLNLVLPADVRLNYCLKQNFS